MFPIFINPLSVLLTITTSFGVILHDTQIDRATSTALTIPVAIATFGAAEVVLKLNDPHIHTERFSAPTNAESLRSGQPRTPVRDDDKKYVSVKKYVSDGMGSEYHWPSI
jgi:hypothetical protein